MDTGMDFTGDIGMDSGMDTTMECGRATVPATGQEGPQPQGMCTGTGPVVFAPRGRPEIRPIMQETGQVVLTRVPLSTTGPPPETGHLPVRPLQETEQGAEQEPNPPPGKIMYMPEETGMCTEEIITEIFNSVVMASGVAIDLQVLQIDPEASNRSIVSTSPGSRVVVNTITIITVVPGPGPVMVAGQGAPGLWDHVVEVDAADRKNTLVIL